MELFSGALLSSTRFGLGGISFFRWTSNPLASVRRQQRGLVL